MILSIVAGAVLSWFIGLFMVIFLLRKVFKG